MIEKSKNDIYERIKQLVKVVLGPNHPYNIELNDSAMCDPMVIINNVVGIYWEESSSPEYMVCGITHDPGVMYHSDGSGTPPSDDYQDVGAPSKDLPKQVLNALQLVIENEMGAFLVEEAFLEGQHATRTEN